MNFISTGVKEVTRRLRRSKNRLALANARKFVEKAEINLGRHGWRKLAGDESVRPVYERIVELDTQVAAANAHIAGLEAQIQEQEAAREAAAREHQTALDAIEGERGPVQQGLQDLQNRRADHQKALHDQGVRKAALQAEQAAFLKLEKRVRRQNLLADESERAARQTALDDQRAGLAEKAAQLTVARAQAVEPVVSDQESIKTVRARLNALDSRRQDALTALAARERAIDMAIAGFSKEIAATRRQAARVEEQKCDSYLAMGRRLAEIAAAPEGTDEFFTVSQRHRQGYEKLLALDAYWQHESQNANKQDLRIFSFVGFTVAVLIALTLLLAFHAPVRRDWLPRDTQTILTVDVSRFTDADFTRALQSQEPDAWQSVWTGLLRKVAEVPQIDVRRRVERITRAFAPSVTPGGPPVDYLLVKMRDANDVETLLNGLWPGEGFGRQYITSLPIYEKTLDLAVAQVGPDTIALGSTDAVEALIRVRLGLPGSEDLKSDAQFFSEFQRLGDDSAFRLVTYRPRELMGLGNPVLNAGMLGDCQTLGLTLDMREPVSAVIVLNTSNTREAFGLAHTLEAHPDQVLQLTGAGPNLFIEPPSVHANEKQVEWRFRMTAPAAREFLQRVSRLGLPNGPDKAVAEQ